MAPILLVAHTPRAGRHNHRFLVPPGVEVSDAVLGDFFDAAAKASAGQSFAAGANYLAAIRRCVKQQATDRRGDEMLLLLGVNVPRLRPATRRTVERAMQSHLDDLEALVLAVAWDREGQGMLVERPELAEWSRDLPAGLPAHPAAARPLSGRTSWGGKRWVGAAAVVMLLILAVAGLKAALAPAPPPAPRPPTTDAPAPAKDRAVPTPVDPTRKLYDEMVGNWKKDVPGLTESQIRSELLSAAQIKGGASDETLLADKQIKAFLRSPPEERPFFFVKDKESGAKLKELMGDGSGAVQIVDVRERLVTQMAALQSLRKSLADAHASQFNDKPGWESIDSSGNILKLVRALGGDRFEGLEDWKPPAHPSEPLAPVFTNAEGKGAELVPDSMSRILSWYGHNQEPSKRPSASELLGTLRQKWNSSGGLKGRIEQARGKADTERDKDSDAQQSQGIYDGVIALQKFLECILADPPKPESH